MTQNQSLNLYLDYKEIFSCPICLHPMQVNHRSLVCPVKHTFDISKHGYVNMLLGLYKSQYDKSMFLSRKIINKSGFFTPLIEEISFLIAKNIRGQAEQIKILDAGCGEGYHLAQIKEKVFQNSPRQILGVGIDIAKEGIIMAAKTHKGNIWCVADIAKVPFQTAQFDFILNILSPANYAEFKRISKKGATIIKVVPNSNYLLELREIFYEETEQVTYSNTETMKLFEDNLQVIDIKKLKYSLPVDNDYLENLSIMTPLSWATTQEKVEKLFKSNIKTVTVDFSILIGKS